MNVAKASSLLTPFFPQGKLVQTEAIKNGLINQTYKVILEKEGQTQAFILQEINQKIFQEPIKIMTNIHLVGQHLSQNNYKSNILQAIPSKSGKTYHLDDKGKYWRLFPFIENTCVYNKVEKPILAYEAARAFGQYLAALWTFPIDKLEETIPHFHDPKRRYRTFEVIYEANPLQNRKLARTVIEFIQKEASLLQRFHPDKLPLRVTHNDTKINNVLFDIKTENACCIIDLDTLMPGHLVFDFGDMVRTFCNRAGEEEQDWTKVHLDLYLFEKLCQGFFEPLGPLISDSEKKQMINGALLITYEQAIRFLNDYLTGDRYYAIQYPGHNLCRAYNQTQLLRSMLEQEGRMQEIVQQFL